MMKFNKDIISLVVVVLFLFNSTVHGIDTPTKSNLRAPLTTQNNPSRLIDSLNKIIVVPLKFQQEFLTDQWKEAIAVWVAQELRAFARVGYPDVEINLDQFIELITTGGLIPSELRQAFRAKVSAAKNPGLAIEKELEGILEYDPTSGTLKLSSEWNGIEENILDWRLAANKTVEEPRRVAQGLRGENGLRSGFFIARIGGLDGVSVEVMHRIRIMNALGHKIYVFTGELENLERFEKMTGVSRDRIRVVPNARLGDEDNQKIRKAAFGTDVKIVDAATRLLCEVAAEKLKKELELFISENEIEVGFCDNIFGLPSQVPFALAMKNIAGQHRRNMRIIAWDHDWWWERYSVEERAVFPEGTLPGGEKSLLVRPEYASEKVSYLGEEILTDLKPSNYDMEHVVVGTYLTDADLKDLKATLISNIVPQKDVLFGTLSAERISYIRTKLGIEEGDSMLLVPVRPVPRKQIELDIELAADIKKEKALNTKLVIMLPQESDNARKEYVAHLIQKARDEGFEDTDFIFASDKLKGIDIDPWELYQASDVVLCASFWEGDGNNTKEAIASKRCVVAYPNPAYRIHFRPRFQLLEFPLKGREDRKEWDELVKVVGGILKFRKDNNCCQYPEAAQYPEHIQKMVDENYARGRRELSEEMEARQLGAIISKVGRQPVLSRAIEARLERDLGNLYGQERVPEIRAELTKILAGFYENRPDWLIEKNKRTAEEGKHTEKDIALITYADTIRPREGSPLEALYRFVNNRHLKDAVNSIHMLPFYPWDIDGGFSVKDYREVDPRYGTWGDIDKLREGFDLMFDCVANHASIDNPLVQGALIQRALEKMEKSQDARYSQYSQYRDKCEKYRDFVIAFSEGKQPADFGALVRPRPTSVLTKYWVYKRGDELKATFDEPKDPEIEIIDTGFAWTTFSVTKTDGTMETVEVKQVDLNFANPEVLLEMVRILLFYINQGAGIVRLDAIGYIWKARYELGTEAELGKTSLHEPEAHTIIQILTDILAIAAPGVVSISEVNEPQKKAIEYIGKEGEEEANLFYQFAHYPLAVHALLFGTAKYYKQWIPTTAVANGRQFSIVAASHDGMGLKPLMGLLPEEERERLASILIERHKALPNYGSAAGKQIVYELCTTPWNAVNPPDSIDPLDVQVDRFLALIAMGLASRAVPAIYINALLGMPNNTDRGENRDINRQKFDEEELYRLLEDPNTQQHKVFTRVIELIKKRTQEKAFNPQGPPEKVIDLKNDTVDARMFESIDGSEKILTMVNVSNVSQTVEIDLRSMGMRSQVVHDIISEAEYSISADSILTFKLKPYQTVWLKDDTRRDLKEAATSI